MTKESIKTKFFRKPTTKKIQQYFAMEKITVSFAFFTVNFEETQHIHRVSFVYLYIGNTEPPKNCA